MAESNKQEQQGAPGPAVDPVTAFWRDVWAKMGQAAASVPPFPGMPGGAGMPGAGAGPGVPGMPGMPAMPNFAAMMSPEAIKRMQSAYFDSMAQYSEQYMRSPQFLESMKKSMDQALQFRRQMDDYLKQNMAESFEAATGGANSELLGAIRRLERTVSERLDDISRRVEKLECEEVEGATRSAKSTPAARKSGRR